MKQAFPKTAKSATLIGYYGLFFWTIAPVLVSSVRNIPTFQVLCTALGVSFTSTALFLTYTKRWKLLKQPIRLWIIGILAIYGNDVLYIAAFKYAPPAQADLISYLWPILVILFSGLLPKEKFTLKHLLAGLLGFTGIYVLLNDRAEFSQFQTEYVIGYLLALGSAIVWSIYTLTARHYGQTRSEAIGVYCGVGMLCSLLTHYHLETFVPPTSEQWLAMITMGLTTQGLAYFCWDYGVKRGDFKLLNVLSYSNPIVSVLLLIVFGYAEPSLALLSACVLITLGGMMAGISWPRHLKQAQIIKEALLSRIS